MDELIAFLNARLDEDERIAHTVGQSAPWSAYAGGRPYSPVWAVADRDNVELMVIGSRSLSEHIARHDPARVLADVGAKQVIVDAYEGAELERGDDPNDEARVADATTLRWVVCVLASAYADHPDYREEWRPE